MHPFLEELEQALAPWRAKQPSPSDWFALVEMLSRMTVPAERTAGMAPLIGQLMSLEPTWIRNAHYLARGYSRRDGDHYLSLFLPCMVEWPAGVPLHRLEAPFTAAAGTPELPGMRIAFLNSLHHMAELQAGPNWGDLSHSMVDLCLGNAVQSADLGYCPRVSQYLVDDFNNGAPIPFFVGMVARFSDDDLVGLQSLMDREELPLGLARQVSAHVRSHLLEALPEACYLFHVTAPAPLPGVLARGSSLHKALWAVRLLKEAATSRGVDLSGLALESADHTDTHVRIAFRAAADASDLDVVHVPVGSCTHGQLIVPLVLHLSEAEGMQVSERLPSTAYPPTCLRDR